MRLLLVMFSIFPEDSLQSSEESCMSSAPMPKTMKGTYDFLVHSREDMNSGANKMTISVCFYVCFEFLIKLIFRYFSNGKVFFP